MNTEVKFLITGGHMTPALAVLEELKGRGYKNFMWVGHKYNQSVTNEPSAEYKTVSDLSIPFVDLKAGKLARFWGRGEFLAGLKNLLKVPWGFIHAFWIILRHKPQVVVSFGGYIALPIVVAGKILRKRVVTHEQTAVTGLTNKIIPKFAEKIFISWPSSAKYYPAKKTILTGNPLRPEIFEDKGENTTGKPIIYITGGNQGSHKINNAVFAILPELLKLGNVVHQTGNYDAAAAKEVAQALKAAAGIEGHYHHAPFFFGDQIGTMLNQATLVIARSGANTVYELLALGKPAIFIPIPWVTHNEQFINASLAKQVGLAEIINEKDLNQPGLLATVTQALQRLQQGQALAGQQSLTAAKTQAMSLVKLDAAKHIVDEIEALIKP